MTRYPRRTRTGRPSSSRRDARDASSARPRGSSRSADVDTGAADAAAAKYAHTLRQAALELEQLAADRRKLTPGKVAGGLLGIGGALSFVNPFGLQLPELPGMPWPYLLVKEGPFGFANATPCYVSLCSPITYPVGVVAVDLVNCGSVFPHCPFGSVLAPTDMKPTYRQSWYHIYPEGSPRPEFAAVYGIKTGVTPGYFSHETYDMNGLDDIGVRIAPLLSHSPFIAPWTAYGDPNTWPKQKPEPEAEPDPEREQAAGQHTNTRQMRRVTISRGSVRRPPIKPAPPPRRPPPNVREGKVQFSSLPYYRLFMGAIDAMTETQDFIRAIYNALPCAIRSGAWKTQNGRRYFRPGVGRCHKYDTTCQLNALNAHADDVDWQAAVINVIANAVEDQMVARQNKAVGDLTGATKSEAGYARYKASQQVLKQSGQEFLTAMRALGLLKGGCS